ncbi:hypothetical protein LuPra_01946 [Luteitalea pratensis]|uniref:DUF5666 domain-containing protein n=1 Tax=Luteitalea pratensis TaxID=1855912 RepID=A0A143PJH4_LUTPR|nr:hypothetical protein [Luteitalea pratensis]AMY08742.1 hypothetical protein LuPra_01946 [Luteitalea pratensis]
MRSFLLSALGLVALVGSAAAQPLPTELWAGGVIVKVDSAARTVDVRQGASEQTYVLAADADVKDGSKTVTDLGAAVGQQVRLKYVTTGTTRTTSIVKLLGVPKAGSAAAASAAAVKATQPAATPE